MKVDKVVKQETLIIFWSCLILSVLMQSVFLVGHWWRWSVLWGNLFGLAFAVLNFFLMGLTVQKAVGQTPEEAKTTVKGSQMMRNLMLIGVMAAVYLIPVFHTVAGLLPLLFPRIAIALRSLVLRKGQDDQPSQ